MKINRPYRKSIIPPHAKRVFEGVIFDVYQWEQELFDGSMAIFEKATRPDTAGIFPILPDGRILIAEDTQPGRGAILTPPEGRVEEGETPEQTVRRELLEETGYSVETVEPFYSFQPVAKLDWFIYLFIGRGAKKVAETRLEAGEKVSTQIVTFDELLEIAQSPQMYREDFGRIVLEAKQDPVKMAELRKKFSS